MLKAIFFDADDTIIDHHECERQALIHMFSGINVPFLNEYHDIFRPLDRQLWDDALLTSSPPVAAADIPTHRFKLLFERIAVPYTDYTHANELFKTGLANTSALFEHAEETVAYLHSLGYTICVVTNGKTALQKPRVANSKIGKYISRIIVSEEVAAPKPSPIMFDTLLAELQIAPAEAIMIGDSLEKDIQGAFNAGIKAVWYNPEGAENHTNIRPDYEITSLLELKDMFMMRDM